MDLPFPIQNLLLSYCQTECRAIIPLEMYRLRQFHRDLVLDSCVSEALYIPH